MSCKPPALHEYLRFYFRGGDGCRPGRLLFDLRLIGKSYGPSRDRRAAAAAATAVAAAFLAALPPCPRLGGVHTTNAAGRILNHKFMAPACSARSTLELSRGEACVALLQRFTLFTTRSPSIRSRPPLRSFDPARCLHARQLSRTKYELINYPIAADLFAVELTFVK